PHSELILSSPATTPPTSPSIPSFNKTPPSSPPARTMSPAQTPTSSLLPPQVTPPSPPLTGKASQTPIPTTSETSPSPPKTPVMRSPPPEPSSPASPLSSKPSAAFPSMKRPSTCSNTKEPFKVPRNLSPLLIKCFKPFSQ